MSFLEKYQPVYAPDMEVGSADSDVEVPVQPQEVESEPKHDGPGSGRSRIRADLEAGFDRIREANKQAEKAPGRAKKGDRVGQRLETLPDSGTEEQVEEPGEEEAEVTEQVLPVPEGISAEAKAEWDNTPSAVQAAFIKRIEDMNKGVGALRAQYAEIEQALTPHLQAIAAHGKSPGQAVNQLFAWFDALGKNPTAAFPALARSFGYDLRQFVPRQQPQPPAGTQPQAGGQPQQANGQARPAQPQFDPRIIQPYLQQALAPVQQGYQQLQQQLATVNQQRTEENLAIWAKDKPYFEEARERMAYLIGSGAVPLKDGKVDLDGAYDQALWSLPEVRSKIQQDQARAAATAAKAKKQAELKAQQEQAEKARRAATSIPLSAPGVPPRPGQKSTQRKTVGETLREAIASSRQE